MMFLYERVGIKPVEISETGVDDKNDVLCENITTILFPENQ
jgi:hypothetical protein